MPKLWRIPLPGYSVAVKSPIPLSFPNPALYLVKCLIPGIPFQIQTRQNFFPSILQRILEIPLVLGFWIWRSRRKRSKVETDLSRCLFFSVLPACFSRVYSISGFRWVSTQHHGCPRSSFALFWDNHGLQTRTPQISSFLRSKNDPKSKSCFRFCSHTRRDWLKSLAPLFRSIKDHSWLVHRRFPAFGARYMYFF